MHKLCDEYVGMLNTGEPGVSITRMHSPAGWVGPAHSSDFDEYAIVLSGVLHVEHADGKEELEAGQAIHVEPGEEVILSTPAACEYLTVCTPAYSKAAIHRSKAEENATQKR
jgi:quercetin dioxygenase-like cupin family protein